ncbi:MAG TPA: Hsp70 family protein [Pirellulaceae bacterium]|nr:Hsp70 family protein [Pirellulaceae bacterium]
MPMDLLEVLPSRYVVGIDLGTTNSAVCFVDTEQPQWQVKVFSIPQLVAAGQVEARDTLPSFSFQPPAEEATKGLLKLPWSEGNPATAVGFYARDFGGQVSGRLIGSAKSWLCHSGVNRTAPILPWHAADDVERLSPVEASSRYLAHVRDAWNHRHRSHPLEEQDVVLTLPASFDEVARELTVEAAAKAGLSRVVLIEEPQAAFYAWIYKHTDTWSDLVAPGQKILVCDIGGGTTDFTLIRVRRGEGGKVQFHRVAVGDHLILGGDNFDLALAQHVEKKLTSGGKLPSRQWDLLVRLARQAKEQLLGDHAPESVTVTLPGSGSKLIGGSQSVSVSRDEVHELLVDGFMPLVNLDDKPAPRRSGFQEFGLPYASDPAMTRYLAAFLTAHRYVALEDAGQVSNLSKNRSGQVENLSCEDDPARPDVLLFNGGVFESPVLRQRLIDSLSRWFSVGPACRAGPLNELATTAGGPARQAGPTWHPTVLDNDRLDLAVARGAAYYGMVRRGQGVKIAASLARTYYIGIEVDPACRAGSELHLDKVPPGRRDLQAICLLPGSAEPGQEVKLPDRQFDLLISEPAEFPLYVSSTRLADRPGEMFAVDPEQMTALPPIRTALKTRRRSERGTVTVELHAKLTEIGTLELWCSEVGGERSWRLQFDVRSATQTDMEAHESAAEREGFVDEETWRAIAAVLDGTLGPAGKDDPDGLIKRLTAAAQLERGDWPTSLLRRIWEALIERETGRRKSPQHEARWLNLLGYALRPGYGLAVDDWRVAETWRTVQGKLAHGAASSRTESLILWRRIAGGFSAGQQQAIAEPLLSTLRSLHRRQTTGRQTEAQLPPHESLETLRLLGSLELLPVETKLDMGNMLIELLPKRKLDQIRPAIAWALARIGARVPVYGPLNTVVSAVHAAAWLERLLGYDLTGPMSQFAVVQLARRTDDRYRDIAEPLRDRILAWLDAAGGSPHAIDLVRTAGQLDADEQSRVFGESLPKGLRIR